MTNENKITNLLTQIKQIVKTHEEHANKQGENFNIFKILRMERKEVETHSRFIYELLNPKGSHGQGNVFLKSFAKIVLGSEVSGTAIDPQREDLTADNRRIDFTLETDVNIIGIEMKIDAGDQKNQLFDYYTELKNRANKKGKEQGVELFYLTIDGSEASEYSLGKLTADDYHCISFGDEILNWINDCIQQSAEKSVLREALIQYKILIEKITGKNMDINTKIAELISKNTENFKSALEMEKGLTQSKINFQVKFWEELLKKLGEGYSLGNKDETKKYKDEEYHKQGIIYKFNDSDAKLMLIHWDYIHFFIVGDNNQADDSKIKDKSKLSKNSNGWFQSDVVKDKLNFKEFDNDLIDALSGDKRKETIQNLADEFKELVKKLENE